MLSEYDPEKNDMLAQTSKSELCLYTEYIIYDIYEVRMISLESKTR